MMKPIMAGWQRPRTDDSFHFKHIPGAMASLPRVARLVWSASPPLTILLGLLNLVQGFIPASSVSVTALLIDSVVRAIQSPAHSMTMVLFFVGLQLGITLLSSLLSTLSNIAQQLMQEQVSNRIQYDILKKAATLDLAFFENPEFYDKMRQAANQSLYQPVSMISQTFDLFRTSVTLISLIALLVTLAWWLAIIALLVPIPAFFSSTRYGWRPVAGAPFDGLLRDVDDHRYLQQRNQAFQSEQVLHRTILGYGHQTIPAG
jgi:ATP-binding cassette subfamily B protein